MTSQLWQLTFGEQYAVEGGMYRGEPPEFYYCYKDWSPAPIALATPLVGAIGASSSGSGWLDPKTNPAAFQRANARTRGSNANQKRTCFGRSNSPSHLKKKKVMEDEVAEFDEMIATADARAACASPTQRISAQDIERASGGRVKSSSKSSWHHTDPTTGYILYDTAWINDCHTACLLYTSPSPRDS